MRNMRYLPVSLLVLLADQVSKLWAYDNLRYRADRDLIDGFLKLSYAENPGIVFGLFAETESPAKTWLLAAISLSAAACIVHLLLKATPQQKLLTIALSVLLGGIAGNLIDRFRLGAVIDFIELYIGQYHWPTFNIADTAICVGAVLIGIDTFRSSESKSPKVN
ncbi:MAG: signal peptidase II [Acidobacteriota bacterium]|nr:signal peptidase II [Blastocatellia bacterium]MDW8412861.1 signal peptidase II [Acidobacteriota bacterium]